MKKAKRIMRIIRGKWQQLPRVHRHIIMPLFVLGFASIGAYLLISSRAAGIVYNIPTTIPGDCGSDGKSVSRDVTGDINEWMRSVPDGLPGNESTLVFGEEKCYRVDGTLVNPREDSASPQRQHLIINGNNSTIDQSKFSLPSQTAAKINHTIFNFRNAQNVTIENFTLYGQHTNPCNIDPATGKCRDGGVQSAYEWFNGIAFEGGTNVVVRNNKIYNVYGDGVGIFQGPTCGNEYRKAGTWADDHVTGVLVENNLIDGTGRHGIGLTGGKNVRIAGNTFDRISYHVADLEYECYQPIKNISFDRNTIKRHYLSFIASKTGGEYQTCAPESFNGNYVITNNVMEVGGVTTSMPIDIGSSVLTGPTGQSCPPEKKDMRIEDNTLRYPHSEGTNSAIRILTTSGTAIVQNNRIIQPGTTAAVQFLNVPAAKVLKNNNAAEAPYVYSINNVNHASGADACSNTTSTGTNQPVGCTNIDTTAPNVFITAPVSGAVASGVVTVTAGASDSVGVNRADLFIDGVYYASDSTSPFEFPWDTTLGAAGSRSLQAKAYDIAGNIGSSSQVSVTVKHLAIPKPSDLHQVDTDCATSNVTLVWRAPAGVSAARYNIKRFSGDPVKIGESTITSWTGWNGGATNYYTVSTVDASGNESPNSSLATVVASCNDTTAPTVPAVFAASATSSNQVYTRWNAASDNVAVTGYVVQRNGTTVGRTNHTSFIDETATPGTSYTYSVIAVDAAGNASSAATASVTTPGSGGGTTDITPPSVSITSPNNGLTVKGPVLVTASAADNVGVQKVEFYVDNTTTPTATDSTSPYEYSWDTTKVPEGSHTLKAKAYDAAGNTATSASVTVTVQNTVADTTAPSVPTGLSAAAVSSSQINTSWNATTDNVGVTGYKIYRNGSLLATTSTTSYSDNTVRASTTYRYTVAAYDAAGNNSAQSAEASVTTPDSPDTIKPTAPTNLRTTNVTSTRVDLAWGISTDNVGVEGYFVYRGNVIIAAISGTSYSDTSVQAGANYTYTVRAYDAIRNVSDASNSIVVTVPAPTSSDTTPPSAPTNLRTTKNRPDQINLDWNASTDNVRVAGYRVFRNGTLIGTTTSTDFGDGSVERGTAYTYTVVAFDASNNVSPSSNTVNVLSDNPGSKGKNK